MEKFLSKLQYKNYEPGEFVSAEERSFEEVASLIRSFPWDEQRHLTPLGPTCPSVTVEDKAGNYCKIGPFYNNKFCIYLYTSQGKYLKKSVADLDEGVGCVQRFFEGALDETTFEHEHTLHPLRHFATKEFLYHFSYQGAMWSMIFLSIGPLMILFMGLLIVMAGNTAHTDKGMPLAALAVFLLILDLVLLFLAATGWRLFLNHYRYAKNQLIRISRGRNDFEFGTGDEVIQCYKDRIVMLKEHRNTQSRSPWAGLYYTELIFNDGKTIKISSLLLRDCYARFPGIKCENVAEFCPLIR